MFDPVITQTLALSSAVGLPHSPPPLPPKREGNSKRKRRMKQQERRTIQRISTFIVPGRRSCGCEDGAIAVPWHAPGCQVLRRRRRTKCYFKVLLLRIVIAMTWTLERAFVVIVCCSSSSARRQPRRLQIRIAMAVEARS